MTRFRAPSVAARFGASRPAPPASPRRLSVRAACRIARWRGRQSSVATAVPALAAAKSGKTLTRGAMTGWERRGSGRPWQLVDRQANDAAAEYGPSCADGRRRAERLVAIARQPDLPKRFLVPCRGNLKRLNQFSLLSSSFVRERLYTDLVVDYAPAHDRRDS